MAVSALPLSGIARWKLILSVIAVALAVVYAILRMTETPIFTTSGHLDATADFTKDGNLVREADDIFFGTVTEKAGSFSRNDDFPETQFTVTVDEVLLGDVSGSVTVNQLGGFVAGGTVLKLFEDDPLLQPGQKYLLFTTPWRTEAGPNGWQSLFYPRYTKQLVSSPAHEAALVARYGPHIAQRLED